MQIEKTPFNTTFETRARCTDSLRVTRGMNQDNVDYKLGQLQSNFFSQKDEEGNIQWAQKKTTPYDYATFQSPVIPHQ